MYDNYIEIKNEKRINFLYIFWTSFFLVLSLIFVVIMGTLEKENYNIDNTTRVTGVVDNVEWLNEESVIKLKNYSNSFTIFSSLQDLIDFQTLKNNLKEGDEIELIVLKSSYDSNKPIICVLGILSNNDELLSVNNAINALIKNCNDNLIIVYCLLSFFIILLIFSLIMVCKINKLKKIDIAQTFISAKIPIKVPAQLKYRNECLIWSGVVCIAIIFLIIITFLNIESLIYYIGFSIFFVFATIWMIFLIKKEKTIIKNFVLPIFVEKFNFDNKHLIVEREIVLDLANWCEFKFTEKGIETVYRFFNENGEIVEISEINQDNGEGSIDENMPIIKLPYDNLNLSAKTYFKSQGELICVIIKSNLENKINGLKYDLHFKLDENFYAIIKKYNIGVLGLEESLKDLINKWENKNSKK